MGWLQLALIHHVDDLLRQLVDLWLLLNCHELHALDFEQLLFVLLLPVFEVALLVIQEPVEVPRLGSISLGGRSIHGGRECALLVRLVGCLSCLLLQLLVPFLLVGHGPLQEVPFAQPFVSLDRQQLVFGEEAAQAALFLVHFLNEAPVCFREVLIMFRSLQSSH